MTTKDIKIYIGGKWWQLDELINVGIELKWIPIYERLPALGQDVLITINGEVRKAFYCEKGWSDDDCYIFAKTKDIRAWMPLPEPYEIGGVI